MSVIREIMGRFLVFVCFIHMELLNGIDYSRTEVSSLQIRKAAY